MDRNYDAILHPIIDPLVSNPDAIMIRVLPGEDDRNVTVLIVAEDDDTARLIGKRGAVANALREVIAIAPKADPASKDEEYTQRIHLKFESFGEEDK